MIRTYFNLKDIPFKKNIASRDLFASSVFSEANKRLEHIKENRGFFLLTGNPGVGKTTVLRYFRDELNENAYKIFYVPLATVSVIDFYRQLNYTLCGTYVHRKTDMFRSIQDGVRTLVQNRKMVPVFIFDEAHLMKNENFTELQLIFNFEFDSVMPAVVIIAGQSHLRDRISREILTSFQQRIALKYHLTPLNQAECSQYIEQTLKQVGGTSSLFSDNALQAIFNNTQGNIREIGNLAEKALLAAAIAKKNTVSEEEVFLAAKEV